MLDKLTRGQWLLTLLGGCAFGQDKVRQLTTEELEKIVADEKNLFFLDVREPKEIEELGTLKGYTNIPLGQLEARISEVPKNKVIVTA
jgi:rhodanese-related sulfurtransferase